MHPSGQKLVEDSFQQLHCQNDNHFGGSFLACEKVRLPVFASKMKKIKRAKKRKKFLALLNVGASLHLCNQLNFLSFICSNKTVTENPCGPKKLNSDVHSYIWTLEPCRLDCSSRKVKRSGYLLDFIFGRHAKLSQCFFSLGWHNL